MPAILALFVSKCMKLIPTSMKKTKYQLKDVHFFQKKGISHLKLSDINGKIAAFKFTACKFINWV